MPASEWLHLVHLRPASGRPQARGKLCHRHVNAFALRALFCRPPAPARVAPSLSNCRRRAPLTPSRPHRLHVAVIASLRPSRGPCRAARLLCYGDAALTVPSRGALAMAHIILLLGMLIGMLASSPGAGAAPPVDRCFAVSQAPRRVQPVAFRRVVLQPNEVRLEFVGHSTWLIESAAGVNVATDYNDYVRPAGGARHRHHEPGAHDALLELPRSRHQARAARLEPRGRTRQARRHLRRRARAQRGHQHPRLGRRLRSPYGNSIFIFEIAGMCIGHLGHLHHTLTDAADRPRSASSTW